MDSLLSQYSEKFGESFPIFLVMGMSDDEIDDQIKESIKNNKPFKPEIIEGVDY